MKKIVLFVLGTMLLFSVGTPLFAQAINPTEAQLVSLLKNKLETDGPDELVKSMPNFLSALGQVSRFILAMDLVKVSPVYASLYIENFGIEDEKARFEIAKISVSKDPRGTSQHIEKYKLSQESDRLELALIGVRRDVMVIDYSGYQLSQDSQTEVHRKALYYHTEAYLKKIGKLQEPFTISNLKEALNKYAKEYPERLEVSHVAILWDHVQRRETGVKLLRAIEKDRERNIIIPQGGDSLDILLATLGFSQEDLRLVKAALIPHLSENTRGDLYDVLLDLDAELFFPLFLTVTIEGELWKKSHFKSELLLLLGRLRDLLHLMGNTDEAWRVIQNSLKLDRGIAISNIESLLRRTQDELFKEIQNVFQGLELEKDKINALQERWGNLELLVTLIARYSGNHERRPLLPRLGRVLFHILNGTFETYKFEGDSEDEDDKSLAIKQLSVLSQDKVQAWRKIRTAVAVVDPQWNQGERKIEWREILVVTTFHDPRLLLMIGDLVKGVTSCLNYKIGERIEALLAYVIDANVEGLMGFEIKPKHFEKVTDFDQAFENIQQGKAQATYDPDTGRVTLTWEGREVVLSSLEPKIRHVLKLGETDSQKPGLFLEDAKAQWMPDWVKTKMSGLIGSVVGGMAKDMDGVIGETIHVKEPSRNSGYGVYSDATGKVETGPYSIKAAEEAKESGPRVDPVTEDIRRRSDRGELPSDGRGRKDREGRRRGGRNPFSEEVAPDAPQKRSIIYDRDLIKARIQKLRSKGMHHAHTIILLVAIGGSENVGHHLSNYFETGEPIHLKQVYGELSEIAGSTAVSAELWAQIMGSSAIRMSEEALLGTADFIAEKSKVKVLPGNLLRTQFLLRQAMGYSSFLGWEFGRALYKTALKDFEKELRRSGSQMKQIDSIRAQDILEVLSDSELRTEMLASILYVLWNDETRRQIFQTGLRRWINWDLVGTYAALGTGGLIGTKIGVASVGRLTGLMTTRQALGYLYGKKALVRLGMMARLIPAARIVSAVLSFGFVIDFAIGKELDPVRLPLVALNRWTILTPRKEWYTRRADDALAGLEYPDHGGGPFELGYRMLTGDWTKDADLARSRLKDYGSDLETVISDHLEIMGHYLLDIQEVVEEYAIPEDQKEFAYEYLEMENEPFTERIPLLEEAYDLYMPVAKEISSVNSIWLTTERSDFEKGTELEMSLWERHRQKRLQEATTVKEKEDIWKNLTPDRYRARLKYKLEMLKREHPLLDLTIERVGEEKQVWEWLEDLYEGKAVKIEVLHEALLRQGRKLQDAEHKLEEMMPMLFPQDKTESLMNPWESEANPRLHIRNMRLEQYVRNFNMRKDDFLTAVSDQARYQKNMTGAWTAYAPQDQKIVEQMLKERAHKGSQVEEAFRDLFAWDEEDYLFIQNKMTFLLTLGTDGFNEEKFLKDYEAFRKSLDDEVMKIHYSEVMMKASESLAIEFLGMKYEEIGLEAWEALVANEEEVKKLTRASDEYVQENLEDRVRALLKLIRKK